MSELVHGFSSPPPLDDLALRALLGGKGAGLARMTALELPVPPGFTVTTDVCRRVLASGWFNELDVAIAHGISQIESQLGRRLGDDSAPLLLSIRSGAPVSMPGMMDTVLNAGMSEAVASSLSSRHRDQRFAWDTYRRFVQSYAAVVSGAPQETVRALSLAALGPDHGLGLSSDALADAGIRLRSDLETEGYVIPRSPVDQVREAIAAVFRSWHGDRAEAYRRVEGIAGDLGTAATVQTMVFGNLGESSGTGVVFTRDPVNGERRLTGDFLANAQGEDVVAGTHAIRPITELGDTWPELANDLDGVAATLERELADVVDIEFTIERNRLWLLQARVGRCSPRATLRIVVEMADDPEFPVDRTTALERVADLLDDPPSEAATEDDHATVVAAGLAASPGRAVGELCVDVDDAVMKAAEGRAVVLIRSETSPSDVHGMAEARGLVTTLGGMVSHAAVVARAWGIPAIVGAAGLSIGADGVVAGDRRVAVGETVTVDGDGGRLLLGSFPGLGQEMTEVQVLRGWQRDSYPHIASTGDLSDADFDPGECRRLLALKGLATADALSDATAVSLGAVERCLDELATAGETESLPGGRFRLTTMGTAATDAEIRAEAAVAGDAIEAQLTRFHEINDRFKLVVTDWQMRTVGGHQEMNDHSDPTYDRAVLARLRDEIHVGICEIIDAVTPSLPRFGSYRRRLGVALAAIDAGDQQMVAHPIRDSYHTVWFELHEELIRLTGRNRADEAAAGRA